MIVKKFQQFADWASVFCGTPQFLFSHIIWWSCWFIFKPEPFPFNFLTMLLSLEAIVLAILILNSSNRQGEADRAISQNDLNVSKKDFELDKETHTLVHQIWKKLNE